VDLLVLAVSADQAVDLLTRAIEAEKAENVIVIPGGLDEKAGAEHLAGRMRSAVAAARARPWRGPLVVGGNSMGIRSHPGRYDTTFIPPYKLPLAEARPSPLAFISQSGAFFAAKAGKLGLTPRYAISAGNQMDLTIGDYLTHLKDDREVDVFAVYCEGFRPLDGLRSIEAARGIKARGGTVVLYRAGRTPAGADASASHTAAIAGDYAVTRELARQAGIVLCDTTEEFEDLTRLFALLGGRLLRGLRLGALSNAGFECVSIADNASDLRLAGFSEATRSRLRAILDRSRIGQIVDVRNPLDLTPMADDAAFEEAVRAVLEDENVDVGFVGCVPATPALQTLPPGPDHGEDLGRAESVATRLIRLFGELRKPWAVAVDGGPLYDPLVRRLEQGGVPTFRSADRALRMLSRYCRERLGEATA
jgi:acyl-CoA synthetase (NDP forming)